MGNHWGYTDPDDGHVTMKVPTDMAEEVSAFVANPEGFMDALARAGSSEEALGVVLVEIESGVWVNPSRIIGLEEQPDDLTRVLLDSGGFLESSLPATDVLEAISEKLSAVQERIDGEG